MIKTANEEIRRYVVRLDGNLQLKLGALTECGL